MSRGPLALTTELFGYLARRVENWLPIWKTRRFWTPSRQPASLAAVDGGWPDYV